MYTLTWINGYIVDVKNFVLEVPFWVQLQWQDFWR